MKEQQTLAERVMQLKDNAQIIREAPGDVDSIVLKTAEEIDGDMTYLGLDDVIVQLAAEVKALEDAAWDIMEHGRSEAEQPLKLITVPRNKISKLYDALPQPAPRDYSLEPKPGYCVCKHSRESHSASGCQNPTCECTLPPDEILEIGEKT